MSSGWSEFNPSDLAWRRLSGVVGRLAAQEVDTYRAGDALPVPDAEPVAVAHEAPDLVEQFGDTVCIPEARVATHGADGCTDALLLSRSEAGRADD